MATVTRTPQTLDAFPAEAVTAAREYRDLRDRRTNPDGRFDRAGRWYPAQPCSCNVRWPSRAYPYSLLVHCRTADHVAERAGVARVDVLRAARILDAQAA